MPFTITLKPNTNQRQAGKRGKTNKTYYALNDTTHNHSVQVTNSSLAKDTSSSPSSKSQPTSKTSRRTDRRSHQREETTDTESNFNTDIQKSLLETNDAPPLRPITDIVLGSIISGTVVGISPFGVFVKIPYDLKVNEKPGYALLHKSQIQEEIITSEALSQMFRVGQVLSNLRVISVNYAKGEVGVSIRSSRAKRHPISYYQIGQHVQGKVASITEYGAFIDIGAKVNPLLHISRISQEKITNIRDILNEGDTVSVRIIDLDDAKKFMSASMLSSEADEYLTWRSLRKRRAKGGKNFTESALSSKHKTVDKAELEHFEDTIRDLEKALGV